MRQTRWAMVVIGLVATAHDDDPLALAPGSGRTPTVGSRSSLPS